VLLLSLTAIAAARRRQEKQRQAKDRASFTR